MSELTPNDPQGKMWDRNPEVARMLASDDSDVEYVEVDLETGHPVADPDLDEIWGAA